VKLSMYPAARPGTSPVPSSRRPSPGPAQVGSPLRLGGATLAATLAIVLAAVIWQPGSHAQVTGAELPYSRGFLVTGDYVAGGVNLPNAATGQTRVTGTIPMGNAVPANADIVAAYLVWETITSATGDEWKTQAAGVQFRGFDIDVRNVLTVRRTSDQSTGAKCYGSGALTMHMFRADVLRFLPMQVDADGKPTGKRLVNDADLLAGSLTPHTVTLPSSEGNNSPKSAGASLIVVYRDLSPDAPLKKVVLYDGLRLKAGVSDVMDQKIQGFYWSAPDKSAKITHIAGSGQPNNNDRISFQGQTLWLNAINISNSAERAWTTVTADVSPLMTPATNPNSYGPYGETVTTRIDHAGGGGNDCISWAAVVFSTSVADEDRDGLPDGLEDVVADRLDPDGRKLPNLKAIGAGSDKRDLLIEINAMEAGPGTAYGAPESTARKVDAHGHTHMPTPYVLRLVGEAFEAQDIRVKFDVGDLTQYRENGRRTYRDWVDDYASTEADRFLITDPTLARGGEIIMEEACDPLKPACHFPDFPGTVPWKLGMQAHRDAPVDNQGQALAVADMDQWEGRRRFDIERRGLFRYLLYAHARGTPKSLPCLVDDMPAPYSVGLLTDTPGCREGTENPDFDVESYHVPTSASGVADLPGPMAMVTLGMWDEFVGRPYVRASTTLHELGHTLGLWHGGPETVRTESGGWAPGAIRWGTRTTPTVVEANCKPNYLSSMSYLFQVHGLFDDRDEIHLDFSGGAGATLVESGALPDSPLFTVPAPKYRTAWFAPAGSALVERLGAPQAKRYCSGARFDLTAPPEPMARVHTETLSQVIDWNGDGWTNSATGQDVNFDGRLGSLHGYDDWSNIRLDQAGAIVTGALPGSAEGVWFDNAGGVFFDNAGGVFFDNSGVFFDMSGVFFDNSGVWFDNAGGVFFDMSGVFFDNAGGVWFDNSGVWFDNAGGVWFDNAGGVFFDNAGGVFFDNAGGVFFDMSGVFFDNAGGAELTYEEAQSFGRGVPHRAETCVIGRDALLGEPPDTRACSTAAAGEPDYHRVEVAFEQLQVGGVDAYEVQRRSDAALPGTPDAEFASAGFVEAHLVRFTDPAELANGIEYIYRVRGIADDEYGNSGWSREVRETAVNVAPVAEDDSYSVTRGGTLNVAAALGILANDTTDVDSPATSRRVFSVTGATQTPGGPFTYVTAQGTFLVYPNGSFTYTANAGTSTAVTTDSFTYRADNGAWSGNPAVPLSPPSNEATVTVTITPPPSYGFVNVQNLPPPPSNKGFKTGSTIPLRWQWTDASGVALDTRAAAPIVLAYACSVTGSLPGALVGEFSPSLPGSGNSFQFDTKTNTWDFNWKLQFTDGGGVIRTLPTGTYVVQVSTPLTGQIDPAITHTCGTRTLRGALITVVK
jgi:hypothetical protein